MTMTFTPSYKEKGKERFYYKDDAWKKCDNTVVAYLFQKWASSNNAHRIVDDEGFIVSGFHFMPEKQHKEEIEIVKDVLKLIEKHYGCDLSSKSRKTQIVYLRYVFIVKMLGMFPNIGVVRLGDLLDRDHATIIHARKTYELLISYKDFNSIDRTITSIIENYISNG